MKRHILIIAGPTGVGKTEYAIQIALQLNGEIISADSMQIYKYMDIGSAKPTKAETELVKHYLVDEIDPFKPFSAAEYAVLARQYIDEVFSRGKLPVICGGTGLYINSLIYEMDFSEEPGSPDFREKAALLLQEHGADYLHSKLAELDPEAAANIHPNNTKKVIRALEIIEGTGVPLRRFKNINSRITDYDVILIGISRPREELYDRINLRVDNMMEEGLEKEVRSLVESGLSYDNISMMGIGYKEMISYINGECSLSEAVGLIKKNSRHLAKRQMTWFRRYEDMKWFDISGYPDKAAALADIVDYVKRGLNETD